MKWPHLIYIPCVLFLSLEGKVMASEMDYILLGLSQQTVTVGELSIEEMKKREASLATVKKEMTNPLELELVDTVSTSQSAGTDFIEIDATTGELETKKELSVPMQNSSVGPEDHRSLIPVFYFN